MNEDGMRQLRARYEALIRDLRDENVRHINEAFRLSTQNEGLRSDLKLQFNANAALRSEIDDHYDMIKSLRAENERLLAQNEEMKSEVGRFFKEKQDTLRENAGLQVALDVARGTVRAVNMPPISSAHSRAPIECSLAGQIGTYDSVARTFTPSA